MPRWLTSVSSRRVPRVGLIAPPRSACTVYVALLAVAGTGIAAYQRQQSVG
jgi:hypothetical protein